MTTRAAVAMLAAFALVACGEAGSGRDDGARSATDRIEGNWIFVSGDTPEGTISAMPGRPITLELDVNGNEGAVGGQGACNGYGVEIGYRDGKVVVGEMTSTLMGCAPRAIMDLEQAYARALARIDHAERGEGSLVLTGPGTTLTYEAMAPVDTVGLIGVRWRLDGVVGGDVLSPESPVSSPVGDPAYLVLRSDGTIAGSLGCRTLAGEWLATYGRLVATRLGAASEGAPDGGACDFGTTEPTPLGLQEGVITEVLGSFVPTLDGDRLLLQGRGQGLIYSRAS